MALGLGIVLLVAGLILGLNVVNLPASWDQNVDSNTLGWILVAVGALAILLTLVISQQRSRTTVVERRTDVPPTR
ncbi:MAG: hypothetical protein JWR35_428 [Marmoricola sp.]|jgi:hypothetical protein|nr:hypothetical protein [Marmoricola sp.]